MLFNAPFIVKPMIGFIALAGILVRNLILLIDCILRSNAKDRLFVQRAD